MGVRTNSRIAEGVPAREERRDVEAESNLTYGGRLVLDVHPKRKTIVAHGELPGFRFDVTAFFARGDTLRDA